MTKKDGVVAGKSGVLFLCVVWFACSCATIKKTVEPVVFQRNYENNSAGEVYNGCITAIQKRNILLRSYDRETKLISTDWISFKKPGSNLKYRYRFDLEISESPEKRVEFLLKCEYQKGFPIYPNPINPTISSYEWRSAPSDKYLEEQLDAFFQEVDEYLKHRISFLLFLYF
jgi:hypothetical protein